MTVVNDILRYLGSWCPVDSKESWDNVGLLVGQGSRKVKKILVALDITTPVIEEAVNVGAQLIVSHHPVIFQPISSVTDADVYGSRVMKLVENNIAAISMHTNLDFAPGGVEDILAKTLGMREVMPLDGGIEGRTGYVDEMPLSAYLKELACRLNAEGLRYYDAGKPVHKVCTCCGAGGDCLELAVKCGCDTFITGDLKYFNFIEAAHYGINLIDAGHYPTENVIVHEIVRRLSDSFEQVEVHEAVNCKENISYFVANR